MEHKDLSEKDTIIPKKFVLRFPKISDLNIALNIQVNGRTLLRWDRYEREWYMEEESCVPLYQEFIQNTVPVKRISDVGRQLKNIREYTEKVFTDRKSEICFFQTMFRFRNMSIDNILLTACFYPQAHVFKTQEEWNELGFEPDRSGMYFFDLYPVESTAGTEQAENIARSIAEKLKRTECQRAASYLIRKNATDSEYFDIFQASYESGEEIVTPLCRKQSQTDLKNFIENNILDQEIYLEQSPLLLLYPDTSVNTDDMESRLFAQASGQEMSLDRLYNMLCWFCQENDIAFTEDEVMIESAIKRLIDIIVQKMIQSVYQDSIRMILNVFYGLEEIYPDLQCEITEGAGYQQKRECLKEIKRNFDFLVYNMESYMDKEVRYQFDSASGSVTEEEDVRGEQEESVLHTVGIQLLYEMPQEPEMLEGIYIQKDDEALPVKIELHKGELVICKIDEVVSFSVQEYNLLVESGYEKITDIDHFMISPRPGETGGTSEGDHRTPAEKKWIAENQTEELHNITLRLWQLKEAYKDKYRGISYKIFREIYKYKVRKERYEKKIEITLKACENLSELKDTFYYQILMDYKEGSLLGEYFINGGPDTIYIGDLIEIYSSQDNRFSLNYVDVKGFVEISREEFYGYESGQISHKFIKEYEKDRILAYQVNFNINEQTARMINVIPQSVLPFPTVEEQIYSYREKGIKIAEKIMSVIQEVPVLICSRSISLLKEDEAWAQENEPDFYKRLCEMSQELKTGSIIPFIKFVATINAYQDAAKVCREKGLYQGYDVVDFLIFGKAKQTENDIYLYFSSMKIGSSSQCFYDYIKDDLNLQYRRLCEEYGEMRKRNGEAVTYEGRAAAERELESYEQMAEIINEVIKTTA